MVFKDKGTNRWRYQCDICRRMGHRRDWRHEADGAERAHLIKRHNGAEVFAHRDGTDELEQQLQFPAALLDWYMLG